MSYVFFKNSQNGSYVPPTEFDKADVLIYEEVRRMSPFERPFLVLVGPNGVGRRALKERLIKDDPRRFGTPIARE